MSNGRVQVQFVKAIPAVECKGGFGYGRNIGECASLPAAEALALAEKGVVIIVEQEN